MDNKTELGRSTAVTGDGDMALEAARFLPVKEVVKFTRFSPAKVYGMIANGELPSLRHGKSVRVPLAGLIAWAEAHTRTSEAA